MTQSRILFYRQFYRLQNCETFKITRSKIYQSIDRIQLDISNIIKV